MQVAVCGPAACTDDEAKAAFEVGRQLVRRGVTVLCGGGPGVMASVAAGARSLGGLVVSIRPDQKRGEPAGGASVVVSTNLGEARNAVLVSSADAVIAVGGSWGTLSEVALAMRRAADEPGDEPVDQPGGPTVVTLGGWRVLDGAGDPVAGILEATSPEHAVSLALGAA